MEDLQSPTLNNLARETGIHKQCLLDDINRMQAQLGMTITKVDFFYKLTHWGPILKPEAVRSFLNEADA
jgi:hypothetical protein